jgi:hypothetical protein
MSTKLDATNNRLVLGGDGYVERTSANNLKIYSEENSTNDAYAIILSKNTGSGNASVNVSSESTNDGYVNIWAESAFGVSKILIGHNGIDPKTDEIYFSDKNILTAGWVGDKISFSNNNLDWSSFKSSFGETSLLDAFNQLDSGKENTLTKGDLSETDSSILTFGGVTENNVIGSGTTIRVQKADTTHDGYISKGDWNTFNSKQDILNPGNISSGTTSALNIADGDNSTIGPDVTISINKASAIQDGYLGKDDWSTFNGKQDVIAAYDLSETASGILTVVGGPDSVLTNNVTIQVKKVSAIQDGYLGKNDFSTFNNKVSGPVESTDGAIVLFNGTDGKVIKNSTAFVDSDGYIGSYGIKSSGKTSGVITVRPPASFTSWNFTLPSSDGDSGQLLKTDGSGLAIWATVTAGSPALSDWAISTSYVLNQEVMHVGFRFKCTSAHTSDGTTFFNNLDKWVVVSQNGLIVNQSSHGFSAKDVLYVSSGTWAKAKADVISTLSDPPTVVVGGSTNYFLAARDGRVTISSHGLSANTIYYLSAGTAGLLTSTEPSTAGQYSNPILRVVDSNDIDILNYGAKVISSSGIVYSVSLGITDFSVAMQSPIGFGNQDIKIENFYITGRSSWSTSGSLNTARKDLAGSGTQNSALSFGGWISTNSAVAEKFNGSIWSSSGNLNTARSTLAGSGIQNASLSFGGYISAASAVTEKFNGSTWSTSAGYNLNTARYALAGSGTQSASLSFGGSTGSNSVVTEKFDGSIWSTLAGYNLNTARYYLAGSGTQSAAVSFGGSTTGSDSLATTEKFNGSIWAASGNLNTARWGLAGSGTQNASLSFGGHISSSSAITEKFNGSTWTASNNLNAGRFELAGAGTQNAALSFGGYISAVSAVTEKFNGVVKVKSSCFLITDTDKTEDVNSTITISDTTQVVVEYNIIGYYSDSELTDLTTLGKDQNDNFWSTSGALNTARYGLAGAGTQNAGLSFGGNTGSVSAATEKFNGSTWIASSALNTARYILTGAGTQNAALSFGGYISTYLAVTEKFNVSTWAVSGNLNTARYGLAGAGTQGAALSFGGNDTNYSAVTEKRICSIQPTTTNYGILVFCKNLYI